MLELPCPCTTRCTSHGDDGLIGGHSHVTSSPANICTSLFPVRLINLIINDKMAIVMQYMIS